MVFNKDEFLAKGEVISTVTEDFISQMEGWIKYATALDIDKLSILAENDDEIKELANKHTKILEKLQEMLF